MKEKVTNFLDRHPALMDSYIGAVHGLIQKVAKATSAKPSEVYEEVMDYLYKNEFRIFDKTLTALEEGGAAAAPAGVSGSPSGVTVVDALSISSPVLKERTKKSTEELKPEFIVSDEQLSSLLSDIFGEDVSNTELVKLYREFTSSKLDEMPEVTEGSLLLDKDNAKAFFADMLNKGDLQYSSEGYSVYFHEGKYVLVKDLTVIDKFPTLSDAVAFIKLPATESVQGKKLGDCYVQAYNNFFHNLSKNPLLCHGVVTGKGELEGVHFTHAWIEIGDTVIDTTIPIFANGIPKQVYYSIGQIQEDKTFKYNRDQVLEKALKWKTYGPWEDILWQQDEDLT